MMAILKLILTIVALSEFVEPAKILGIFPINSQNHFYLGHALMQELASRGHQVTVLSPFALEDPFKNYTSIDIGYADLSFGSNMDDLHGSCSLWDIPYVHGQSLRLTETVLAANSFQDLINSGQHFDVVIIEYAMNEALFGIGEIFNAPVVLFSPYSSSSLVNHLFSNPSPPAYVPNIFTSYANTMGYWERFTNLIYYCTDNFYRRVYSLPLQSQLLKQYLSRNINFDKAMINVSLVLLNSHPVISEPIPRTPNMIEIGGFHIKETYTIPADVKRFMDGASEGVIVYLDYGELTQERIWQYFDDIPQKVLIRKREYGGELDVPQNVKIVDSLDLPAVLGHEKTVLLICHSNFIDIIESVYAGVPFVAIGSEMDQNVAHAIRNGYAFFLPEDQIDSGMDTVLATLLKNHWYTNNVKRRSRIMRDQAVKPMDSAVFWIEYVIRNQGASELKSSGVYLNWFQKRMIDIMIVLVVIDIILFLIFYYIFSHILRCIVRRIKNRKSSKYDKLDE